MSNNQRPYRGRFAPSPTGDLHFGSLVAAVASFLEARRHHGKWLIRIEDIDPPREVAGSADRILQDLARLGMISDEDVLYQSTRGAAYDKVINDLLKWGDAYWCGCSRSDLPASGVYPGTCRNGLSPNRKPRSVRLRTKKEPVTFEDRLQGEMAYRLCESVGDFVIRRADGFPAYQLAVAVDDAFQNITDIVRGADLLDSTARQIFLQRQLKFLTPGYAHIAVALGGDGKKLSKSEATDPVRTLKPYAVIRAALKFLGQEPPPLNSLEGLWHWALSNWNFDKVPRRKGILVDDFI